MCLATLAAAPVFVGGGLPGWLRWLFVAHGLLFAPTLILTVMLPVFAPPGGAESQVGTAALLGRSAIFLPLPVLLAVMFRRLERQP